MKQTIILNYARVPVVAILMVAALMLVPAASLSQNTSAGAKVIPPSSVAFGRTYGEWSAAWEQWADSIPVANHPLFDNGDCSVGQSGPVWFLGGKFCAFDNPNCGTSNVVRTCSVPAGKALHVGVITNEISALELKDPKAQIADMRALMASGVDGATNVSLEVDGAAIPQLKDRFRVQSPAFVFTLPDDNLFNAVGEGPFPGGAYFPGVDDGVYVMLSPLPAGPHEIHFHGFFPAFNFTLDITYHIDVKKQ
jgi:hypothetical protein